MKKGIIFDLDGTMWDSSKEVAEAYDLALQKAGIPLRVTTADVRAVMGKTMVEIAHIYFDEIDPAHAVDIMTACIDEENEYLRTHSGKVYGGLEAALSALSRKGYFLACVSNCQSGYIEAFYESTGLGKYFSDKECWGGTGLPKSGNIKLVVARNDLDDAVYVGDTMGDFNSSAEAGVKFIHAAYGYGDAPEGTPKISSPAELFEAVEKVFGEDIKL